MNPKIEIEPLVSMYFDNTPHPIAVNQNGCFSFFDSATIGLNSSELCDDDFTGDWKSVVNTTKDCFAKIINATNNKISLFHNTTSAVQRVLTQLNNYSPFQGHTLLTSDVEYPGIYAAANEIWEGPICIVKISDLIYDTGSINEELVLDRICKAIRTCRPSVLYFSHVTRSQGYVFDINEISKIADRYLPYKFFIVDGAQSVGNIDVDVNLLPYVDAYVTSGHKWLCGPQHIGILFSSRSWLLEDPAQSYSETVKSSGTGNKEVLSKFTNALQLFYSLDGNRMKEIQSHNSLLANKFIANLSNEFEVIGGSNYLSRNGIVVFRPKIKSFKMNEIVVSSFVDSEKSKECKASFTELHPEDVTFLPWCNLRLRYTFSVPKQLNNIPSTKNLLKKINNGMYIQHTGQWYRVCFHFYHSSNMVDTFASSINNSLNPKNILK